MYPDMPDTIQAFSKGADNVNWALAREIFDTAYEIVESDNTLTSKTRVKELESTAKRLIDTMQPQMREMLLQKLGSSD